ncbi:MalM family protein [Frateuria defendens]|uniref:MalM family protein n=1 Tax=Frateuria defendens TaxID=2219559 RepID=UPI00066FF40A|nr:MalM family protein [Frateuria defendens]
MPRRRTAPLIAPIALTLLLGACHSIKVLVPPNLRAPSDTSNSLDAARNRLKQATPCCSSFADFSYQTMLPWRPKKFELGPGSPVVNINGVHSYFLAFRLPPDAKLPYRVALKADLNGRWLSASYLFAPTVVQLDEAFQPLDTRDVGLCEYMGWSNSSTGAFGQVEVNSDKARYLVLYSSAGQQTGSTYWEQSPAAFSAEAPVKMAPNGSFRLPHGPDGAIWAGVMNDSYRKAIDNAICDKAPPGDGLLHTLRTSLPVPWLRSKD